MAKVIRASNYDDEGPLGNEFVIREAMTETEAYELAATMNNSGHRRHCDWFRVVDDNYKLFVFQP